MTTVRQYAQSLRAAAVKVGQGLGENLATEEKTERIKLNLILGMVCVLIKLLVDTGNLTDAQVQAAFTAFVADPTAWPDVPDPGQEPAPWSVDTVETGRLAVAAYDVSADVVEDAPPVDPETP